MLCNPIQSLSLRWQWMRVIDSNWRFSGQQLLIEVILWVNYLQNVRNGVCVILHSPIRTFYDRSWELRTAAVRSPTLKLKTIHKCFLCPYKRQIWMLCIQIFTNICEVKMLVKSVIGRLYYINYQYITNTCAWVESPHYLACFVVCFSIVVKVLPHSIDHYI